MHLTCRLWMSHSLNFCQKVVHITWNTTPIKFAYTFTFTHSTISHFRAHFTVTMKKKVKMEFEKINSLDSSPSFFIQFSLGRETHFSRKMIYHHHLSFPKKYLTFHPLFSYFPSTNYSTCFCYSTTNNTLLTNNVASSGLYSLTLFRHLYWYLRRQRELFSLASKVKV